MPSGVAAHINNLSEDTSSDQHTNAMDATQPGAGLLHGGAHLFGQLSDLRVQGDKPTQTPAGQLGPDTSVAIQQTMRGGQLGWPSQVRNGVVVAGPQPSKFGVHPVRYRGAFGTSCSR